MNLYAIFIMSAILMILTVNYAVRLQAKNIMKAEQEKRKMWLNGFDAAEKYYRSFHTMGDSQKPYPDFRELDRLYKHSINYIDMESDTLHLTNITYEGKDAGEKFIMWEGSETIAVKGIWTGK